MKIHGTHYRTIWAENDAVLIIDQRRLPFEVRIETMTKPEAMVQAIRQMRVRGAPLIGVAAAFGVELAARTIMCTATVVDRESKAKFDKLVNLLLHSRPTAVNLRWGIEEQLRLVEDGLPWGKVVSQLRDNAMRLADNDVAMCNAIGQFGSPLIEALYQKHPHRPVNILTHCNAGWLATIDIGTATGPIYRAHAAGVPIHVWVDETRPRLQGAKLTAFELAEQNVPHTIIADNAGGHLMQQGQVDICIVGTDRTTRGGDVTNKIGTYLKALAAHHNTIPFYAAVPSSSIDWTMQNGREIPIEERDAREVLYSEGLRPDGTVEEIRIAAPQSQAANPGFDVTPRDLVTGLITERGVCKASEEGLLSLFPEKRTPC